MKTILEVEGLTTHFFTTQGVLRAVDGVSWDVREGETVGLVGESGCGKSVTGLSIMRLVARPGEIIGGKVLFEGKDLLQVDEKTMQRKRGADIAMIFQEPMTSLNPVLTIGRQITEILEVHKSMDKTASKNRAIELLRLVGITDAENRLGHHPFQLSGGMLQRVMIAMMLSCDPKVLIADEPTTSIDVTTQAQLLQIMEDMSKKHDLAVVLITHNLGIVARHAQRINIMYAGRIVERGKTKDIFSAPMHPYTIGLLSSIPRLDVSVKKKLSCINGKPPDLIHRDSRCAFLPRCTYAVRECKERPWQGLREVRDEHWTACLLDVTEIKNE